MEQGLVIRDNSFELVDGQISFPDYERLLMEATELAHYVKNIEVTDENVKESKKVLAKMNKAVKQLNDRRIGIKKEILEPYEVFAGQIKSIEVIIKEADEVVRNQVRQLEEAERDDKRSHIEEIWNMRIGQYEYAKLFTFDDFIEVRHLNKTTSMKAVEEDMVEFLEQSEKDLSLLSTMDDNKALIRLYKDTRDVATTIQTHKEMKEEEKKQAEVLSSQGVDVKELYIFKISDKKDAKLVEMLLKENAIDYTLEVM